MNREKWMRALCYIMVLVVAFSVMYIPTVQQAQAATTEWKFDFGNKGTQSGFTGVDAGTSYDSSKGYGFRRTDLVKNMDAGGSNELSDAVQFTSTDLQNTFDVDLPNGLYEVTVFLGNTTRTSVRAEDVLQIINMTGDNATASFLIPITDGQLNIMATEGKANYPFTLSSLTIKKVSDETVLPPTVWICGDSTVCNYYPLKTSTQAGWGQVLDEYIDINRWSIHNMAASGQYAKGFVDSGQFDTIMKYGKQGDIYIISIGINDTNYSNEQEYHDTVLSMAKQAKEKGMQVVLVKQQGRSTDISRDPLLTGRWFGSQLDSIGEELDVQVVDLFNLAQDYFLSIGQEATTALYMTDDTLHPNREGAKVLAKIMSEQIDFTGAEDPQPVYSDNTIYIAGDSTAQSYNASYAPQQGWGYYLQNYITSGRQVANYALAGRSSKKFYNDGRLDTILNSIKEKDYLLIQFGINDAASTIEDRYAPVCGQVENATDGSFEFYIKKYVEGALNKGATPVLISPTLSLKAYNNGQFEESYTNYRDAMKMIADYYQVPFINMNKLMVDHYNQIGYDSAKLYHLYGVVEGSSDMTHFCEAGAENAAKLLATQLNTVISEIDKKNSENNSDTTDGKQVESLNRGLVAVKTADGVYLSWRLLGTEDYSMAFNVYRNGEKIADSIKDSTNYTDTSGSVSDTYTVRTVVNGVEKTESDAATVWSNQYLDVPINKPADMDGATYSANDATVADVDDDGEYEIILKWDPSNSQDNSKSGTTSNVYIDCYELDGQQKWRIDLGKNIRAGAHYTQFIAYDLNGDGKAEIAMKTADGTVAGDGTVIGDASKDYRNSNGYILDGPEYLTLFDGETGKILDTIDYEPARGTVSDWGDKYGNRVDRFLATVAYLDGKTPSLVMCRGYYTRAVLVAYDCKNGKLNHRWTFDSNNNTAYAGQGNHNLTSADVDDDGKDEIVYGSCVIDDNGQGLYSTGMGHGDAMHVSDFDPDHPGLEVFQVHEEKGENIESVQMRDAKTGTTLWCQKTQTDVGRGIIANIGPDYYPYVVSCSAGNYDKNGNKLDLDLGKFGQNFLIWWDGDLYREGLDRTYINKYNYETKGIDRLLTDNTVHSNNSTKANPSLSGDILGDWREEVIWPTGDDTALRIYTTTIPTEKKLYTLEHDIQYRESIAWQNVAYNQPPHTSYYMGADMPTPQKPNVYAVGSYRETKVNGGGEETQVVEGAKVEEGIYMIKNAGSGLYMDVAGGTAANGTNVQQWGATEPGSYNTWKLVSKGDGYYQIYSEVGDKSYLLDLDYGKVEDGTNIQIYQDTDCDAQLFKFVKNDDGTYGILTKATKDKSAISVENDSTGSGANIVQSTYKNTAGQKWILERVQDETTTQETTTEEVTTEETTTAPEVTTEETTTAPEGTTEEITPTLEETTEETTTALEVTTEETTTIPEVTTEETTTAPEVTTEEVTSIPEATTEETDITQEVTTTEGEVTTSETTTTEETVTEESTAGEWTTTPNPTVETATSQEWSTIETTAPDPTTEVNTSGEWPVEPTAPNPTTEEPTSSEWPVEPTAPNPTTEEATSSEWPVEPTAPNPTTEEATSSEWPVEPTAPNPTTEETTSTEWEVTEPETTTERQTEEATSREWPTTRPQTTTERQTEEATSREWPTTRPQTTTERQTEEVTSREWPTTRPQTTTERQTEEPTSREWPTTRPQTTTERQTEEPTSREWEATEPQTTTERQTEEATSREWEATEPQTTTEKQTEEPTSREWPTTEPQTTTERQTETTTQETTTQETTTQETTTQSPISEQTTTPAANNNQSTVIPAVSIKVNRTTANVVVGLSKTVKVTILPGNTTDKNVVFTSSNTKVATVDANGKIKGIRPGTATVTVKTSNGKICKVAVKVRPAQVKGLKKKNVTAYTVRLTWKKQKNVTGYIIYRNIGSSKKYKYYKTVRKNTITIKQLKSNTSYRFKIRAYKQTTAKLTGACSDAVKVKTKRS